VGFFKQYYIVMCRYFLPGLVGRTVIDYQHLITGSRVALLGDRFQHRLDLLLGIEDRNDDGGKGCWHNYLSSVLCKVYDNCCAVEAMMAFTFSSCLLFHSVALENEPFFCALCFLPITRFTSFSGG